MMTPIRQAVLCLVTLWLPLAAGGCVWVQGPKSVNSSPPPPPAQVSAADDHRSIQTLRNDNTQLRAQMEKLERDHSNWMAAVDQRRGQIDDLKRQRKNLERDRDKYKKMLKKMHLAGMFASLDPCQGLPRKDRDLRLSALLPCPAETAQKGQPSLREFRVRVRRAFGDHSSMSL